MFSQKRGNTKLTSRFLAIHTVSMRVLSLSKTTLFRVFWVRCSHCLEFAAHSLEREDLRLLEIGPSLSASHTLRCEQCEFRTPVENKGVRAILDLHDELPVTECEDANTRKAAEEIARRELEPMFTMIHNANLWTCDCGEENPPNFGTCWNCGHERDDLPKGAEPRDIGVDAVHPWEQ